MRIAPTLLLSLALLGPGGAHAGAASAALATDANAREAQLFDSYQAARIPSMAKDDAHLAQAEALLRPSADAGYAWAQYSLSLVLWDRGRFAESVRWSRAAAEQGFLEASVKLIVAYAEGKGVAKDEYQSCLWTLVVREGLDREEIDQCRTDLSSADYARALSEARVFRLRNGQFKDFPQHMIDGRKQGVMALREP